MADAGVACADLALELDGEGDLLVCRERDELLPPEIEHRGGDAVGRGESGVLVDRRELGVVACLEEGVGRRRLVEGPDIGEALPPLGDHSDAHAGRLRRGELFDLSLEDPYRGLPAVSDIYLDILVRTCFIEDSSGQAEQIRHLRYRLR